MTEPSLASTRPIALPPKARQTGAGAGILIALLSAVMFGLSGPFAKALMETGWSPGAAVLVRVGGAALVMLVPGILMLRGRWSLVFRKGRMLVAYGVIAIAGAQVSFFNAVQTLTVGVALLIEYLAPVLLVLAVWIIRRRRPGWLTIGGAVLAMVGMVLVLGIVGEVSISVPGVLWALTAAVCLAGYFVLSARVDDDLPPMLLASGGFVTGTVAIGLLGLVGLLPMRFSDQPVTILGWEMHWIWPVLFLILVPTVFAYISGIIAAGKLGSRLSSFVGLTEVMFAVLASWLLLAELPTIIQLLGGLGIVAGVVLVRADRNQASL